MQSGCGLWGVGVVCGEWVWSVGSGCSLWGVGVACGEWMWSVGEWVYLWEVGMVCGEWVWSLGSGCGLRGSGCSLWGNECGLREEGLVCVERVVLIPDISVVFLSCFVFHDIQLQCCGVTLDAALRRGRVEEVASVEQVEET